MSVRSITPYATRVVSQIGKTYTKEGAFTSRRLVRDEIDRIPEMISHTRPCRVYPAWDSAVQEGFVLRVAHDLAAATAYETVDREEKRVLMIEQINKLTDHYLNHGCMRDVDWLHELTVAGDPRAHLRSCSADELTSYEIHPARLRWQRKGAPYEDEICRKQNFLSGNLALAVLNKLHPEANYLNMDTMFSYTPRQMPVVEALVSAFIVNARTPVYFRAVSTVLRGVSQRKTNAEVVRSQKAATLRMFAKFRMEPIGKWFDFPTRRHTGQIITRLFIYKPIRAITDRLRYQHEYTDALNMAVTASGGRELGRATNRRYGN